jgi:hypothetical protein
MAIVDMSNEDDLGFTFPNKPSELRRMPDEELAVLYRKLASGSQHPFDTRIERELSFGLLAALIGFKKSSDQASRVVIG